LGDFAGLQSRFRTAWEEVLSPVADGKRVLVVTHIDADGLCSGAIAFSALKRKGANVSLRTVPELEAKTVKELASQRFDFYLFTDLGASLVPQIESELGDRFLLVDHHQIPPEDSTKPRVINAWAYGYDGGTEACSSSMSYFLSKGIDPTNSDLAVLAVVGALADRQDSGPGRSLTGLNQSAAEDAKSAGDLSIARDLTFTGRESRPIHESIALTSTPFLLGLTGNKDSVLALLHQEGFALKDGAVWRTVSSLSNEEKMRLTEVIAMRLGDQAGASEAISGMVGDVYTLEREDSFTPLRDAREFGTLLNSCGRMQQAGAGISVCLGDRDEGLRSAMEVLTRYRSGLSKALEAVMSDPSRTKVHGKLVLVTGEGVVEERLLGPVISIIASAPDKREKVTVGSSLSGDGQLKISSRVGDGYAGDVNLATLMTEAARSVGGVGGGHSRAAGAKIPASGSGEFFGFLARSFSVEV
jgi:single-stranded-DNA-specific exonuclease